jgi:hypothetical protein
MPEPWGWRTEMEFEGCRHIDRYSTQYYAERRRSEGNGNHLYPEAVGVNWLSLFKFEKYSARNKLLTIAEVAPLW